MERGRCCFVTWRFAAALWLLTGPENAWPLTLVVTLPPAHRQAQRTLVLTPRRRERLHNSQLFHQFAQLCTIACYRRYNRQNVL